MATKWNGAANTIAPNTAFTNLSTKPIITLPIACEVLSLYNRSTLITNKKAGYAVVEATTQPYPNAVDPAKGMREFYQTFALQRRSFLFLVKEVGNER